jgi:hypothetical protein
MKRRARSCFDCPARPAAVSVRARKTEAQRPKLPALVWLGDASGEGEQEGFGLKSGSKEGCWLRSGSKDGFALRSGSKVTSESCGTPSSRTCAAERSGGAARAMHVPAY